ncbi:MAG: hypothetical protein ACK5QC_11415 [Bacteroidota bacterium]|jgi:hypothetical protein
MPIPSSYRSEAFTVAQNEIIDNAQLYRDRQAEYYGENDPRVLDADAYLAQLVVVFSGGSV